MARGSGRRRPRRTLEEEILRASGRGPGARTRAETVPPSGRRLVAPPASGTLLHVDVDALVALAAREDLLIALERRIGEHAVAATPVLSWWSATPSVPGEEEERRLDALVLRTVELGAGPAEDVDSRLRELAHEGGLDELGAALALLARIPDPPAAFQDPDGFLRVTVPESPFERRLEVLAEAQGRAGELLVLLRDCAFTATLPRRRSAIAAMSGRIRAAADPGRLDSRRLDELAEAVDAALEKRWTVL
ncbi:MULTISPECIES: DUF2254 family protein [unclassified Rathayibacter]|uniref:DUF2254 family protein n=1 Tax=unclassified Rathayibacter TaxID=2609250 RepID=UPI000CE7F0D8|nr:MULTISPECIES: DUF2254 family protein [unclassified Rathayibacter]PPG16406.1 hypothetical protein C5D36_07445 [Rathayibacter sp. AY1C6]PPH18372.1 hypothetical protein C5C35_04445 [Rathayibacter sp. AY1F8]PPH75102.1 hypothetical protein C5C90_08655 [Rathayibacter sp. AY1D4]PPH90038.1 hypothetical protein C5C64_08535 [Rathayibacter sp. AY1D3]